MTQESSILANPTEPDILSKCADLHLSGLQQGFLSSLGPSIMRLIFEHGARSDYGIFLVSKRNDETQGFLLGTLDTGKFYKDFILKRGVKAAFILLPKIFSLETVRKIFETLFYPSKNELYDLPGAELMDIVISDGSRGSGVGSALFTAFSTRLHQSGIPKFKVTTGEQLTEAAKFYEKHGGEYSGSIELHRGSNIRVYVCQTHQAST
ncbi:MAG: GNAT family N-acetyltransferase [Pseudomonadota bacterium]